MLVLQLVKSMLQETYEFIYENGPLFYEANWRMQHWMERLSVDEKVEAEIRDKQLKSFFETLHPPVRGWVTELLAKVFPTVDHCLHGNRTWREHKTLTELRRASNIHPDYFPRYFIYQVPSDVFGVAEMSSLWCS